MLFSLRSKQRYYCVVADKREHQLYIIADIGMYQDIRIVVYLRRGTGCEKTSNSV
jgi:hypothetical protein